MDNTATLIFRIAAFLGGVRNSFSTGCRSSSPIGPETADRIELRYRETPDGPERMIGLRAEVQHGAAVIVLYEHSELVPAEYISEA
jgi:hypothetical protein